MKSDRRGTPLADQTDVRAAKIRVGDMMQDVRSLRQKGKLSEAYRTALSARTLAKTSRLFYGPDEEQPGDLVHQLRRELRAAGHETLAGLPPLSTAPPQSAVSGRDNLPLELSSRRRLTKKSLGPLPFPEFIPPKRSLLVVRPTDRTVRSGGVASAGQISDKAAPVKQTPSERVEILSPAPEPDGPESHSPSQTTVHKPVLSTQPRVLTNGVPAPSIRSVPSDRPLIMPSQRLLPKRADTGHQQSTRRDQTAAGQDRQTSMTAGTGTVVAISAQRDAALPDARSIWNRKAEPAVLLPPLSNVPLSKTPVRSARRGQVRPAPAPPAERSDADPAGDAVLLPPNKTPNGPVATDRGSLPATVTLQSIDWNDHAGIDDDYTAGTRQTLLWLTLAVVTGSLVGVSIRSWTRFRGKPIHLHDS